MNNRSEYQPHGKVHPETIPTVENTHPVDESVRVVEGNSTRRETVTTKASTSHPYSAESKEGYSPSLPILDPVENTHPVDERVRVLEENPIRRETVTTTASTPHRHSTESKEGYGPSLPILGAIACCIPLAGILGYLLHQPTERVVTRTVTNTVPVLTVPASPVVPPDPVAAPPVTPPGRVGAAEVGPKIVGPAERGPARVGSDRVGEK